MSPDQPNNPLHGVTLKVLLEDLVTRHGWQALGELVPLRCFTHQPSINSSLKFLRATAWARVKVEALYVEDQRHLERRRKANVRRASQRASRTDPTEATGEADMAAADQPGDAPADQEPGA